jgi:signal transduction histidine kinase
MLPDGGLVRLRELEQRHYWTALAWPSYFLVAAVLNALGDEGGVLTALFYMALLVLTGIWQRWWVGAILIAIVSILSTVLMPTGLQVMIGFEPSPGINALGLYLFGVLFLGIGRALAKGYQAARHAGLKAAEAERARAEAAQLGLLLRAAAHEIANPLAPIRYQLAALLADSAIAENTAIRQGLERIDRNAQRLQRLVGDFQDASRGLGGRFALRPKIADIAPLLRDLAADQGPGFRDAGILFAAEIQTTLPCFADADRIIQASTNLLQNALRYTPRGERVALRARLVGDHVRIDVLDSGVGLRAEDAARLFQPLVRLHAEKANGLGLGLWIVKNILEAHHGTARVASEGLGRGSTFTLEFPAVRASVSSPNTTPTVSFGPAGIASAVTPSPSRDNDR